MILASTRERRTIHAKKCNYRWVITWPKKDLEVQQDALLEASSDTISVSRKVEGTNYFLRRIGVLLRSHGN